MRTYIISVSEGMDNHGSAKERVIAVSAESDIAALRKVARTLRGPRNATQMQGFESVNCFGDLDRRIAPRRANDLYD